MEGGRRHYCEEKEISAAVWQEKGMFLYALDCVKVIWGQAGELSVLYFVLKETHSFLLWRNHRMSVAATLESEVISMKLDGVW